MVASDSLFGLGAQSIVLFPEWHEGGMDIRYELSPPYLAFHAW
jgi:hypothetical protein